MYGISISKMLVSTVSCPKNKVLMKKKQRSRVDFIKDSK
jgi:hypothetical protein